MKYGALSTPGGHVEVRWEEASLDGEPGFELSWRERGGPPVEAPTKRGFGSRLIEHGIAGRSSRVELHFPPEGVTCILTCAVLEGRADP